MRRVDPAVAFHIMALPTITDQRDLSFGELLAVLHDLIGQRLVIESVDRGGHIYHQSEGVLERTIDNHLDLLSSPEQPAIIAFHLDAGACFILHKCEFAGASTYLVDGLTDGTTNRVVKIARTDQGNLVVRDAWERDFLAQREEEIEGLG